jgi:hypothetical protein
LVPLEELFDFDDVAKKPKIEKTKNWTYWKRRWGL